MKKGDCALILLFGFLFLINFAACESMTGYASNQLTNISIYILPSGSGPEYYIMEH